MALSPAGPDAVASGAFVDSETIWHYPARRDFARANGRESPLGAADGARPPHSL